jgi:hypothetical protein
VSAVVWVHDQFAKLRGVKVYTGRRAKR